MTPAQPIELVAEILRKRHPIHLQDIYDELQDINFGPADKRTLSDERRHGKSVCENASKKGAGRNIGVKICRNSERIRYSPKQKINLWENVGAPQKRRRGCAPK